jgi:hypothetical protein
MLCLVHKLRGVIAAHGRPAAEPRRPAQQTRQPCFSWARHYPAAGRHPQRLSAWNGGSLLTGAALLFAATGCAPFKPGFYPIGLYSVNRPADLPLIRQAGFNVVAGPASRAFLDAAQANGLKVLASPGTSAGPHFDPDAARRTVQALDAHAALWAWYLVDEPDLNRISPGAVLRANRFLKNLPAHRPTALVIYDGNQAADYANITDLMMIDRYPIPWLPLANFPQHVRLTRLATRPDQPLIAVLQAFDWSYFPELVPGETGLRPPTYRELRCMTYCAVACGANGLFYYCFDDGRWDIRAHPRIWTALKAIVAELNARRPLLEARRVWWPWSIRYDNWPDRFNAALQGAITATMLHVRHAHATVPAGYYVLAVNTTPKTIGWQFRTPASPIAPMPVFGEGRQLAPADGWIADEFAPFDVHIYGPVSLR